MALSQYIKGKILKPFQRFSLWRLSRHPPEKALTYSDWPGSLEDPRLFYRKCVQCFYHGLPAELRDHRVYFQGEPGNQRGYGEHAFHVMWYQLLEHFQPTNFLEIGVFRGQVICLVAYWAKLNGKACDVTGISPFSMAGDSVTKYRIAIDYYADTLANFEHFKLPSPRLIKAYSTDELSKKAIQSQTWDIVYIDGNHDYEIAKADWDICSAQVKTGGVIVLDDSALSTKYIPPIYASRGHPGPSQVAQEINRSAFREILQVGHNRVFLKL